MTNMAYPGNAEIPQETKNRVIATFRQTLKLFNEGKMDDVIVGCDFIMKLDPLFQPAVDLMTKAQNPGAPVDIEVHMRTYLEEAPSKSTEDTLIEAIEALNSGNFEAAIQACHTILQKDPGNNEARDISQRAQEELEKSTFVKQFTQKAEELLSQGMTQEAMQFIHSGLELDETNQHLQGLKQRATQKMEMTQKTEEAPSDFSFEPTVEESPGPSAGMTFEAEVPQDIDETTILKESPAAAPEDQSFAFDASPSGDPELETDSTPTPPAESDDDLQIDTIGSPGDVDSANFQIDSSPELETSFGFGDQELPEPEPPSAPPPREATPAADSSFDFSFDSSEEPSDDRIKALIDEGDNHFHAAKFQEAIDVWSRIYLIDMNSTAANERIEKAKEAMAESERKIEEIYTIAVSLFDQNKVEEAKAKFEEVLQHQPQHLQARSYLQRIQAAAAPKVEEAVKAEPAEEESFLPPAAAEIPEELPRKKKTPVLAAIIGAVIIIVAAIIVVSKFMPSDSGKDKPAKLTADILIEHAEQLYQLGKVDEALQKLNEIEPTDPLHNRALVLIEKYRQTPTRPKEPPKEAKATFDSLLSQARTAMKDNKFGTAAALYQQASSLQELPPEDVDSYQRAAGFADALKQAEGLYNDRNYEKVTAVLSALMDQYPEQKEARELLANAYYNRGIDYLKDKDMVNAEKSFGEALALYPNDQMAEKNQRLAKLYQEYSVDLLYRIYTKYITYR
ncbi:MAG TPA: hypothetical protein PK014_08695 [Thermoanaerobaculia bacterium]|nr:hypothetical protein [Thermoanaerobaculia bacterium]HUM30246.1 hypothetical protein [Thermoanaerobaculia bacterium]HXK68458.1 hypothetical protein [Thermoanaerobaculia bacterium]